METKFFIRLALLSSALIGTLLTIFYLNERKEQSHWQSPAATTSEQGLRFAKIARVPPLFWCENRVDTLKLGDLTVRQEGRKWVRKDEGKTLNFLEIEKWFGRHCSMKVDNLSMATAGESFVPLVRVLFVDGKERWFEKSNAGNWKWGDQIFKSSQLEGAIREFQRLVQ